MTNAARKSFSVTVFLFFALLGFICQGMLAMLSDDPDFPIWAGYAWGISMILYMMYVILMFMVVVTRRDTFKRMMWLAFSPMLSFILILMFVPLFGTIGSMFFNNYISWAVGLIAGPVLLFWLMRKELWQMMLDVERLPAKFLRGW